MSYPSLGFDGEETAGRANAAVRYHRKVRYELGEGGRNPANPNCATSGRRHSIASDCIGFAAWCSGIDRYQPARFRTYGGWINTDSAIIDARGPGDAFTEVPRWDAVPGDWVVYPSRFRGLQKGHVGVVARVLEAVPRQRVWTDRLVIAHCSAGADRKFGYSISYLEVGSFTSRATVLRLKEEFRR